MGYSIPMLKNDHNSLTFSSSSFREKLSIKLKRLTYSLLENTG